MDGGNAAVLDHEGVPLAAITAEDGGAVEGEVKGGGELRRGVAEEAELEYDEVRVRVLG